MKIFISSLITTIVVVFFIWIMVSWINVVSSNRPYDDKEPYDWNAFVVFVEACNE